MCRMLAGAAWSRDGAWLLARLLRLLARAASGDPYLAEVTGGEARHCHGYGFLIAARLAGSWRLLYERFDAKTPAAGEEEACKANLEALSGAAERAAGLIAAAEEAYVVAHARRAGRREPRGTLNAHPYPVTLETPGGSLELYLAHNGGLDKEKLAGALGLEADMYTDSHMLAVLLARRIRMGVGLAEALAEATAFTRNALDLAVVVLERRRDGIEPSLYVTGYLRPGLDEARKRYYQPIGFQAEGAAGYISSTLRDLALEEGLALETVELEGVYRVEPGKGLEKLRSLP
ncbi:hypothetical protein CF15_04575 [Pyrodictium occultum]|uniref:Glutamine amidotransferase type-2 domain-containing protein n=2 Tax=Pyrodictium occultum TaxID=2309 RepID=A0A0V8RVS1_PYROC|nr:hypothetical protein [Pyrodictium occultum]KSW12058.1 hypothetical protein CF15_04575 [Pyrodictium occultum]